MPKRSRSDPNTGIESIFFRDTTDGRSAFEHMMEGYRARSGAILVVHASLFDSLCAGYALVFGAGVAALQCHWLGLRGVRPSNPYWTFRGILRRRVGPAVTMCCALRGCRRVKREDKKHSTYVSRCLLCVRNEGLGGLKP